VVYCESLLREMNHRGLTLVSDKRTRKALYEVTELNGLSRGIYVDGLMGLN
jgi:hypothetical protein